jgi:hypothetical protein
VRSCGEFIKANGKLGFARLQTLSSIVTTLYSLQTNTTKLQLNEFKSYYVIKQLFDSHLTSTNLPFIKVMGTPLSKFSRDEYVTMKLLSGRRWDGEQKKEKAAEENANKSSL